jgi:hypothetical protein
MIVGKYVIGRRSMTREVNGRMVLYEMEMPLKFLTKTGPSAAFYAVKNS